MPLPRNAQRRRGALHTAAALPSTAPAERSTAHDALPHVDAKAAVQKMAHKLGGAPKTENGLTPSGVALVRDALRQAITKRSALVMPRGYAMTRLPDDVESALASTGSDAPLAGLPKLSIAEQKLDKLPCLDGVAATLIDLDFSYNEIARIPPSQAALWNALERLDVSHNRLGELPAQLATCSHLTELSASNNELTDLPAALASLVRVTSLDISYNRFRALPQCVAHLMLLEELYANHNEIEGLFQDSSRLANLTDVILHHNQLVGVARTWPLAAKRKLRRLELNDNHLQFLPPELGLCENLTRFTIGCNPIIFPPHRICKGGVVRVLEYLRGFVGDAAEEVELTETPPIEEAPSSSGELPDGPCKLCAPDDVDVCLLPSGTRVHPRQALAIAQNEIESLKASLVRKDVRPFIFACVACRVRVRITDGPFPCHLAPSA